MANRTLLPAVCLAVLTVAACGLAAEKNNVVITNPKKAGPDFALQGEYWNKKALQGAQVIARGKHRFELTYYVGGLPGAGWSRDDKVYRNVANKKNQDPITFATDDFQAQLKDGQLKVVWSDGRVHQLEKVDRKSPTLGKKPPKKAIVLFDGSSAEKFQGGQLAQGKYLAAGCASKQKFQDHKLHLEFRTPFKPFASGQARGNSGVYVQSRYEVQVLDSFGLEGKDNECGGIYSIKAPDVNACFPPLSWQTYDIDFTAARYNEDGKKVKNARITVRHNGIVIHDDVELPHGTPGRHKEGPKPDAVYLQSHGNPVVYRNIWVVKKGD